MVEIDNSKIRYQYQSSMNSTLTSITIRTSDLNILLREATNFYKNMRNINIMVEVASFVVAFVALYIIAMFLILFGFIELERINTHIF